MYSHLAIFFVMVVCIGTRVYAQQAAPATGPQPPPPENVPRPLPPPPGPPLNAPLDAIEPMPKTPPETPTALQPPLIAGVSYAEAWAIVKRHRQELMKVPGVTSVWVGEKGIVITIRDLETQESLPSTIEGLPIQVDLVPSLPPPPGVVVLRPGGVREQADACPEEFQEVKGLDWRFCVDPGHPEPIPPLMAPPIAGIPYEEALEILERHRKELMQLPGVEGVGMVAEGIEVRTTNPAIVPSAVEGLPIKTSPPLGLGVGAGHTESTQIRPLHAGVAIDGGLLRDTLTSVALSEGRPFLVFPTHIMPGTVGSPRACDIGSPSPR